MHFDMNRTWSQATALVKGNLQLLGVLAGVFVLLPTLAMYLAFPDLQQFADPSVEAKISSATVLPYIGELALAILAILLIELVGQMAMIALLGGSRPTVGEAIGRAARALPSAIGALLLLMLLIFLGGLVVVAGLALVAAILKAIAGQAAAALLGVLIYALFLVGGAYLYGRFCMILPVVVIEGVRGPLAVLKRSWRVTRAAAWKIVGFFVLLGIAYFVISVVVVITISALVGLGGAPAGVRLLIFSLVSSVIAALVAMLLTAILVSIHQQLADGSEPRDVEFDA